MFKFLKKLFGLTFTTLPENVGEKLELKPKPTHCPTHSRYKKSCSSCNTIVQRGY
jgi:hypothetical protein